MIERFELEHGMRSFLPGGLQRVALALCLMGGLACLDAALAQDAPLSLEPQLQPQPKPAARPEVRRPRPAVSLAGKVLIRNTNVSTLLTLSLSPSAGGDLDTDPIAQNLQPGANITVALPKPGVCIYDVHASFEDWSSVDVENDDLCKDPTITLKSTAG